MNKKGLFGIPVIIPLLILIISFILYKTSLRNDASDEMKAKAKELDKISRNKEELVFNTYNFINQSYTSPIRQYLKEPNKIFIKDKTKIWNAQGTYVPSHQQNLMVKEMLLLTGKFKEEDFRTEQKWCQISPHSVLFVKVNNKEIAIDTWSADNGGAFNCYTYAPCGENQIMCLN